MCGHEGRGMDYAVAKLYGDIIDVPQISPI